MTRTASFLLAFVAVLLVAVLVAVSLLRGDIAGLRKDSLRCAQVAEDQRFVCTDSGK